MMHADVAQARLAAQGVIEVHGAAAGEQEGIRGAPVRQSAEDVIGEANHWGPPA
jgi:hypothetical protein